MTASTANANANKVPGAGGRPAQRVSVIASAAAAALLLAVLAGNYGIRHGALFAVGLAAGVVLYHAAFGFTAAWRAAVTSGRGAGLRAQMLMLAMTVVVFTPLIAHGEISGVGLRGAVAPLSVAVICGAFMFGVGMQLGGGCASGTLFTAGGGNARMLITLAAFILGSVLGSWHWPVWREVPSFAPVALSSTLGVAGGVAVSLAMFAAVWLLSAAWERRRCGDVRHDRDGVGAYALLRGPWPLLAGALALALVNIATLLLAGRPWGVTSAFALWGAKLALLVDMDVASWPYWQRPGAAAALRGSVLADVTSIMNFGIMLGALLAASMAGRFAPSFRIPARAVAAAIVGGLLLGYGARIGFGCNIGAFFAGIASTSLHGWLWFAAALAGTVVGARLLPLFRPR